MNQEIYMMKSDIRLFLKEIKEYTKLANKCFDDENIPVDKETLEYLLLDIDETVDVIQSLIDKIEREYENE